MIAPPWRTPPAVHRLASQSSRARTSPGSADTNSIPSSAPNGMASAIWASCSASTTRFSTLDRMARLAYLLDLHEPIPYLDAWELQRSLAGAVSQGAIPDTIVMLEHTPVITLGRRTGDGELHVPEGAEVEIVETDRGGKSTFHGPGQLVCYPIL